MTMITADAMLAVLREWVRDAHGGNISEAARALNIARPSMHLLLQGRWSVSDKVAQRLGYRRHLLYERVESITLGQAWVTRVTSQDDEP